MEEGGSEGGREGGREGWMVLKKCFILRYGKEGGKEGGKGGGVVTNALELRRDWRKSSFPFSSVQEGKEKRLSLR